MMHHNTFPLLIFFLFPNAFSRFLIPNSKRKEEINYFDTFKGDKIKIVTQKYNSKHFTAYP